MRSLSSSLFPLFVSHICPHPTLEQFYLLTYAFLISSFTLVLFFSSTSQPSNSSSLSLSLKVVSINKGAAWVICFSIYHSTAESIEMDEEMGQYTPSTWAVTAFIFSIIIIAISFFAKRLLGFLRKDKNGSFSSNKKVTVIFILGGPGCGKSTQSENIVKHFGYTHLSAGDLLRDEVASGSKNGIKIQKIMKEGKLVPSEITVRLLLRAMEESKSDKFLIDGFPRDEENRTTFENIMGVAPAFVLFLDCSEEVTKKRLLSRDQGREDDNINTIMKRFKVFKECTLPVIEYYSSIGKVHKIDAGKPAEDVFNDIKRVFSLHGVKAT